jgi:hypothetical protein
MAIKRILKVGDSLYGFYNNKPTAFRVKAVTETDNSRLYEVANVEAGDVFLVERDGTDFEIKAPIAVNNPDAYTSGTLYSNKKRFLVSKINEELFKVKEELNQKKKEVEKLKFKKKAIIRRRREVRGY